MSILRCYSWTPVVVLPLWLQVRDTLVFLRGRSATGVTGVYLARLCARGGRRNKRLCAGICKHVRFCWIFVRQAGGAPFHRILAACVIGNVFKPFVKLLCPDSSSAQFPKRLAHGELARYKAPSLNRELVCPNGSRKSADPQDRTRIREHPPSNQSLTSACQGFYRNLSR